MSAKNRGTITRADEFYATPHWCVDRLVEAIPKSNLYVEPCVGDGAIVNAMPPGTEWSMTMDIVQRFPILPRFRLGSFLDTTEKAPGTIITNPPFSLAFDMIMHAVKLGYDRSYWLVRVGLLESAARAAAWRDLRNQQYNLGLYVLPNRPSFTGSGTDGTTYAWLEVSLYPWDGGVRVLNTTPKHVIAAAAKAAREKA